MNEFLTINEVAAITRRSRQWVHAKINDGTFDVVVGDNRTYVHTDSVRLWLESQCESLERRLRDYYDALEEVLV